MSVATEKSTPATVFGESDLIKIESGMVLRVEKWSVRKAMAMGKAISLILKRIFNSMESKGDEGFKVADLIGAIPEIMEECSTDLAFIVVESLATDDGPKLTQDDVLDTFTLDDFAEVLGVIIERNISGSMLGKWSGLLQKLPFKSTEEEKA